MTFIDIITNPWVIGILIGLASGIIVFPIGLGIFTLIRNTRMRIKIKKLIKSNKFLIPLDSKDYDVKAWENQKYGNIDSQKNKLELENLNKKIFKKSLESTDDNFMLKVLDYVKVARKQGFNDDKIKEEFRKKSYTEELINKIFEDGTAPI